MMPTNEWAPIREELNIAIKSDKRKCSITNYHTDKVSTFQNKIGTTENGIEMFQNPIEIATTRPTHARTRRNSQEQDQNMEEYNLRLLKRFIFNCAVTQFEGQCGVWTVPD